MAAPFTDEEMMVLAQLSYKDPRIQADAYKHSLYDMLTDEYDYLKSSLGEDKKDLLDSLLNRVKDEDYFIVASVNDEDGTGFAALAISGPDEKTVTVAARGTETIGISNENSTRDTRSDLQLGFLTESDQQREMNDFMKRFSSYDSIYLTGHSLGGNLVISGAFGFADKKKIKRVVTFNCPGQNLKWRLKNKIKDREGYDELSSKTINYQQRKDIVSDINIPVGRVVYCEASGAKNKKGNVDNHNMIGFLIKDDRLVEGDKKSFGHWGVTAVVPLLVLTVNIPGFVIFYIFMDFCLFINITTEEWEKVERWLNIQYSPFSSDAASNPHVVISTKKAQEYAERLQKINKKLLSLDKRMNMLYLKVPVLEWGNLIQAEVMTTYSVKLRACSRYLEEAAQMFSEADKDLKEEL